MNADILRRRDDASLMKLMKLWPLIVAVCGIIAGWAVNSFKVESLEKKQAIHETRLTNVEVNAAVARINTDALVERILSPQEQKQLESQVQAVSTLLLKASEARQGGETK